MDLFGNAANELVEKEQPLAARMRPRTLDEFCGQEHILAPGRLLRRAIQADQLSSLIFSGPPGTGKTTLASVIAHTTQSHFVVLNAVMSGIKDVRSVTDEAQRQRGEYGRRTILFVDEVHRWNKAQQDALLPWVENGTVILIGATTENPFFAVNRALVSRSRLFQLKPLEQKHLRQLIERALREPGRGYGGRDVILDDDALDHLLNVANGDARALLNALELAVETTEPDDHGTIFINLAVAEDSIQQRAVLYDKEGDYHFDIISAFIKSLRGSDPDATVYWLAKMVHAGEDPRFLFRRMLIFCSEDIGLADPNALVITAAAADAFDRVGMPEGRYHLATTALYLATAPKSNSVFAFFDALNTIENDVDGEVPSHLRDASRDKDGFGHGAGYLYPHSYREHWVAQQYLPDGMQGKAFYNPGQIGYEKTIADAVARRRDAQLAAMLEPDRMGAPPEILTFSPEDRALDQWLERTVSRGGDALAAQREAIFADIALERHSLVLDLRADSGLLTWEALRRTPEGGVWARVDGSASADIVAEQVSRCPEMRRPQILVGPIAKTAELLAAAGDGDVRFDAIIGRDVLRLCQDRQAAMTMIAGLLTSGGQLRLIESLTHETQRLYQLLDCSEFDHDLAARLQAAEEAIYNDEHDTLVNWREEDVRRWAERAGVDVVRMTRLNEQRPQAIRASMIARWFSASSPGQRPSYCERLQPELTAAEVDAVRAQFVQHVQGHTVTWARTSVVLEAVKRQ